jgi:hypothetical protein
MLRPGRAHAAQVIDSIEPTAHWHDVCSVLDRPAKMDRGTGKPAWKGKVSLGMTGRRTSTKGNGASTNPGLGAARSRNTEKKNRVRSLDKDDNPAQAGFFLTVGLPK